ncbi:MAG: glutamyl-tRNA reductase, partial [Pseudomonadota bacterium]
FAPSNMPEALRDLTSEHAVHEAAILSTCNRTEIYCSQKDDQPTLLLDWLSNASGVSRPEISQSVYSHPDEAAVKHAFRVASGLDSMVIGEPQILGQMKQAFNVASETGVTGKLLNKLFHQTFSVAKKVRTDTSIGENPISVAYAGVNLARRVFDSLAEQTALLIGAGEAIELVARHLRQQGVRNMIIANRSVERAEKLAADMGCEAIGLADIPAYLQKADIVVSSTASTLPILGKGAVESALKARRQKPVFMLDLAVPRDIEVAVAGLRNVYLYTVDDLRGVVEENRTMRHQAAEAAEDIIDLQVVRFMRWMRSLHSEPVIRQFRQSVEDVRQAELEKSLQRLRNGSDPEQVLNQLAHDLANKFAHAPSATIKQANMDGDTHLVSAARKIFKL